MKKTQEIMTKVEQSKDQSNDESKDESKDQTNEDKKAEIIKKLKHGTDELNSKFVSSEWEQAEVRLSEFEIDVLKCLATGIDGVPTEITVIGEELYLSIRDKFKKPIKFIIDKTEEKKSDDKKSKKSKKLEEKSAIDIATTDTKEDDKKKKKKAPVIKKIDLMRQENTTKTLIKIVEALLETFIDTRFNCDYGLYTNKIIEFRGITFAYMAWYILETKNAKDYLGKKSKKAEVYEVMCSMQRFINTCKTYKGKSMANSLTSISVSPTLVTDVDYWLERLKASYPFDGITIYNTAPKLLIHSDYDDCIPGRSIKMRPNQRLLMDTISNHSDGFLLFYNAAIASGKTTLASVGTASHLEKLIKAGKMPQNTQLIFCCNISSVRRQVAKNCWNAGIKFAIGSYVKKTKSYKITNHYGTTDENRVVIVASPDVTVQLLEEDNNKIAEDKAKLAGQRVYYSGKYWLFLDEPTVGADILGSKYLESNTKVLYQMPKWCVLSSATMPLPEKIPEIITHHKEKFPDVYIETQITKEISIGCDVQTFDYDMIVPYIGCQNKEQLLLCISKINEVQQLGRMLTYKVAEKLWKTMKAANITDITDIQKYFADVDNLSADKVRITCMGMLEKLSEQTDDKIKLVCSSNITSDNSEIKSDIKETVNFSKLGTSDAVKFLNMNLIVSLDPLATGKESFSELLKDIENSGIDINNYKKFISDYENKKIEYQKNRDYLIKSLKVDPNSNDFEQQRKVQHFEEEAKKRGCSSDENPTINFPKALQVNTLSHWKKYGSRISINASNLRSELDISKLPLSDFTADDWLIFLLFCGIGIYSPYQISDTVYLREVLNLAETGNLAYLLSDSSICYGTNYEINRVFIMADFAEIHSINTVFQLMGRAGRAGKSWKADVFIDNSTARKLVDFVQNTENHDGDLEARNINITFNEISKNTKEQIKNKLEAKELRESDLIEEALKAKKQFDEEIRLKVLNKDKPRQNTNNNTNNKDNSWNEIAQWRNRADNPSQNIERKTDINQSNINQPWRSTKVESENNKKYTFTNKKNDGEKESGVWRRKTDTEQSKDPKPGDQQQNTKYVPPWKKNAGK